MELHRCYSLREYEYLTANNQKKLLKARDIKTNAVLYAFEKTDELINLLEKYKKEVLCK